MRETSAAPRLQRAGWILVGVATLCAFSIVFLSSGVIAGGAGVVCLLSAVVLRRMEPGARGR